MGDLIAYVLSDLCDIPLGRFTRHDLSASFEPS